MSRFTRQLRAGSEATIVFLKSLARLRLWRPSFWEARALTCGEFFFLKNDGVISKNETVRWKPEGCLLLSVADAIYSISA